MTPNANMTSCVPLLIPNTKPSRRESMTPIKNVNSSNKPMPSELSLFFSMANIRPNAPIRQIIALMPGLDAMT